MFLYLIRATIEGTLFFPPIAIVAWPALIASCIMRLSSERPFGHRELWLGLPLVFPALLIAFGTVFDLPHGHVPEDSWQERTILVVLGADLLTCGIIVWRLRDMRVIAALWLLFLCCLSVVAGFEACMCVTNRWL